MGNILHHLFVMWGMIDLLFYLHCLTPGGSWLCLVHCFQVCSFVYVYWRAVIHADMRCVALHCVAFRESNMAMENESFIRDVPIKASIHRYSEGIFIAMFGYLGGMLFFTPIHRWHSMTIKLNLRFSLTQHNRPGRSRPYMYASHTHHTWSLIILGDTTPPSYTLPYNTAPHGSIMSCRTILISSYHTTWMEEILHHQQDGWKPTNNVMFTTYQLVIRISSIPYSLIFKHWNGKSPMTGGFIWKIT